MTLVTRQGTLRSVEGGLLWEVSGLDADDDSTAFSPPRTLTAMSIQVTGTPDSGVLNLYGSNDGTNFAALSTAVQFSNTTGLKAVAAADLGYRYYKVVMTTGGGASTNLAVKIFMRIR